MKTILDHNGYKIPYNRLTKGEKKAERFAKSLLKKAESANKVLSNLKAEMIEKTQEVHSQILEDNKLDPNDKPEGFTWYNFDRSIKIESKISMKVSFEDVLITEAKRLFYEFLEENTGNVKEVVRALVSDAFSTSNGQLDPKKVFNILSYRSKMSAKQFPKYHKAADLIEKSIRRTYSKTYHRISKRLPDGSYEVVDLNFSSVKIPD